MLLILLAATPAYSQAEAAPLPEPILSTTRPLYMQAKRNILLAAEQMPESGYGYQPTVTVRTFGQILGHLADVHHISCSAALGIANPDEGSSVGKSRTTKAELLEALRASYELCDRAYGQSDAEALRTTQFFGEERVRLYPLLLNATHDFEHYGNLVTYLRLKGLVPPSSQQGS